MNKWVLLLVIGVALFYILFMAVLYVYPPLVFQQPFLALIVLFVVINLLFVINDYVLSKSPFFS